MPGESSFERGKIPVHDRKLLYVSLVKFNCDLRTICRKLRGLAGDFHGFAGGADLKLAIDTGGSVR